MSLFTAAGAQLEFRRAGTSGLDLPAFSFGLWQKFGPEHPYSTQREILLRAFDLGITNFDNANRYGPPFRAAEKTFGRLLARDLAHHRDELVLSTKAGNPIGPGPYARGGSRKALLTSLETSLRDLGASHVDIFYHHRRDPGAPLEETAAALATAVHSGKSRFVGISNYDAGSAEQIGHLLQDAGVPLAVHQPRYSIFDRTPELEGLFKLPTALVVYSPLAQGLLTKKYLAASIPDGARAGTSDFFPLNRIDATYRRRATALNRIAEARGQSLAQLALQWVLRRPEVTSALIGASSTWQLEHNLRALDFPPFSDEELALIDEHGVHGTGSGPG